MDVNNKQLVLLSPLTVTVNRLVEFLFAVRMLTSSTMFCSSHLSLSPSDCGSIGWGVSHTGLFSLLSSILYVFQVKLRVLHVILDDVDPSFFCVRRTCVLRLLLPCRWLDRSWIFPWRIVPTFVCPQFSCWQ